MLSLLVFMAAAAAPVADPLAPAWAGQVQCVSPDVLGRECGGIGAYRRGPDGKLMSKSRTGLSRDPDIVMTTVSEVWVKDSAVCGVARDADIDNSTFSVDGRAATRSEAALLKQQMKQGMASLIGKEVCVTEVTSPKGAIGQVRVDGVRFPQGDQRMIWIPAEAGYSVAMP